MAWILEDQEQEEEQKMSNGNWTLEGPTPDQQQVQMQQQPQEQNQTTPQRSLGIGLTGFGKGLQDTLGQHGPGAFAQAKTLYNAYKNLDWSAEKEKELEEQGFSFPQRVMKFYESLYGSLTSPENQVTSDDIVDEMTGGQLIPQTRGEQRVANISRTAGQFAPFGAGGGAGAIGKEIATGTLFGLGEQLAKESGGGQLSQIGSGITLAAVPFFLRKGFSGLKNAINWGRGIQKTAPLEGTPKFLTETGTDKALADLELSSKNLAGRVAKTSEEMLGKFEEQVGKLSEPSFKDIGTFRAADIENDIIRANQKAILDTVSPASETQKKSWEGIQGFVNENFKAAKEAYTKLYDVVEETSKTLNVLPKNTFEIASKVYNDLEKSLIKAPEEGGVKRALEDLINTLKPMAEGNLVEVPLDKIMAGKRSINRLLERSDIIPAPIDLLKPVSKAMKMDTLVALESKPSVKRAFEAAEETFTKAQDIFNNDAVVKMRKSKNPESLTSMFTSPSNLERLKKASGENKMVENFIDRLVIENIASKNKSTARELAKESREYLGKKGQEALDKILEYGDNLTSPGQQSLARGRVLEDIQKAFTTGTRPSETLNLMKNKIGYDLVKDTLNRSPKGKKMWKNLQRMTFEDMVASVIGKDNHIDFEKAKDITSDSHLRSVVKEALGEDGLRFFKQMETYGKNISQNLKDFAMKEKNLFEKISDNYLDKGLKYILYALAPSTVGTSLLPILGVEVGKQAHRAKLFRILEDRQARDILRNLGEKNVSTQRIIALLKRLAQISGRISKEED